VIEAMAMGRRPKEALRLGLMLSLAPLTVMIDGKPEAMLGVYPQSLMGGIGVPWMLGTEVLYRNARGFLEFGPVVIERMLLDFPRLENVVSARNTRAIRFLSRMGFEVGGAMEWHSGVPFLPFHISRAIQAERLAA
jgi:hypothetical protein